MSSAQNPPPGKRWTIPMAPTATTSIVARITGSGSGPLVVAIEEMIADGSLEPGQRLPSIRALASAAGMSPTTVSEAWRTLHRKGMLHTEGRRGTHVSFLARRSAAGVWRLQMSGSDALDLSSGSPDPLLLPRVSLGADELAGLFQRSTYYGPVVEPELERAIREHWGDAFQPDRLTIVDGSMDAMDRLTSLLLSPGDVVVMEDPTFPPIWQLMHRMRCVVRAIDMDQQGPRPSRLHLATAANPRMFIYQPRAQNPTGASVSEERLEALAAEMRRVPDSVIIELDSVGAVAGAPLLTLAQHFPDRVVRVHGFSKSHAPDLRLAAIGGPAHLIEQIEHRRLLGPAWSSRALQHVLTHLLQSPEARSSVARARDVYRRRAHASIGALRAHGFDVADADGFNLWVPVPDSTATAVSLALNGVGVAIGRPFHVNPTAQDHCRVTIAALDEHEADRIARLFAASRDETPRHIVT